MVSENICDCLSNSNYTNFVNPHYKHAFSRNLDIINNLSLKKIMKKGNKFRECREISTYNIFLSVSKALDNYCSIWAKKKKKVLMNLVVDCPTLRQF